MVGQAINHPWPLLIQGGESSSWFPGARQQAGMSERSSSAWKPVDSRVRGNDVSYGPIGIEVTSRRFSRRGAGASDLIIVNDRADAEGIGYAFPLADYARLAAKLQRDLCNFGR